MTDPQYGPPGNDPYGAPPPNGPGYPPPGYGPAPGYGPGYPPPGPLYGYPPYPALPSSPTNGMAVAGLVCGVSALVLCWIPFLGVALGVLAIVLSGVAMASANKQGGGMAIAGLVCGIVSLVPAILIVVAVFSAA